MISERTKVQEPIRFGEDFELDVVTRGLCRGSHRLKAERIPIEILFLLVERPGEIVTRDEIVAKVWGKGAFLDTDNSIRGAIRKIRQLLKDDPENPRFIQTVVGKGYRFVGKVQSNGHDGRRLPEKSEQRWSARKAGLIAAALATACIASAYIGVQRSRANQSLPVVQHHVAHDVYEAYLKGEALLRSGEWDNGRQTLEAVVAQDPKYAPAFAALARAYSESANWLPATEVMPKAENLARTALDLESNLSAAHAVLGYINFQYKWDWAAAEAEMRRALELDPESVESHIVYGDFLMAMGRYEEAVVERRRASALDPMRIDLRLAVGRSLVRLGRYTEAIAEFRMAQILDSKDCGLHEQLSNVYAKQRRYRAAMKELHLQMASFGPDLQKHGTLVDRVYASSGYPAARAALSRALAQDRRRRMQRQYIPPMAVAISSAMAGDAETSFMYFDKAVEERSPGLAMLNALDMPLNIRSDPRFVALQRRLGIPQPPVVLAAKY